MQPYLVRRESAVRSTAVSRTTSVNDASSECRRTGNSIDEPLELTDLNNFLLSKKAGSSQQSAEQFPRSRKLTQNFQARAIKFWFWEILACGTSLLGVLAIVTLLYHYDGRPQPDWPYWISLNTILSMFTVVITASLTLVAAACISQAKWMHYRAASHLLKDFVNYDEASRGSLGSLKVLSSLNVNYVAGLGAILTILSIGIGPTVQQMIVIKSRQINSDAVPTIPRAQSYLQAGGEGYDEDTVPMNEMMGSIYSGMYVGFNSSSGISLEVIPYCPTGNCTFAPFQSLAVCSSCNDLTAKLVHKCDNMTFLQSAVDPNSARTMEVFCEMSLPNGLTVNASGQHTNAIRTSGHLPLVEPVPYGNIFLNYTSITSSIEGGGFPDFTTLISNTSAQQCYMYWCVNTYQSNVQNGQIQETITNSWHGDTTTWQSADETQNGRYLALRPQATSPNFTVGFIASHGLSLWLAELMTLSSSTAFTVEDGLLSYPEDESVNASSGAVERLNAFRELGNEHIFANIAKSMTRNIRSVNLSEQTASAWTSRHLPNVTGVSPASGTAQVELVYVSVRWAWLTLSIVMVGFGMALLVLTALDTRRHDVEVWKSSPLPMLLQALGMEMVGESGTTRSKAEMEMLAKNMHVGLWDDGGGLRLAKRSS